MTKAVSRVRRSARSHSSIPAAPGRRPFRRVAPDVSSDVVARAATESRSQSLLPRLDEVAVRQSSPSTYPFRAGYTPALRDGQVSRMPVQRQAHPTASGPRKVSNADGNGWLQVRLGTQRVALPWYLQVTLQGRSNNRDQFTIDEGVYSGTAASVAAQGADSSYLVSDLTHKGAAAVTFRKGAKELSYDGKTISAYTSSGNPLSTGDHEIQIPDYPHDLGSSYGSYGTTWFRLGTSGDRYLHPGSISAGCATVTDTSEWPDLYRYLINSRQSTMAVGTLKVED